MGSRTWIKFHGAKWTKPGGIIEHNVAVRGTFATLLAVVSEYKDADEGVLQIRPGVGFDDTTLSKMLALDLRTWRKHKAILCKVKYDGDPLGRVGKSNEIIVVGWAKYQPPFKRQEEKKKKAKTNSKTNLQSNLKKTCTEKEREIEIDKNATTKSGVTTPGNVKQLLDMGTMILVLRDKCGGEPPDGRTWQQVIGRYGVKKIGELLWAAQHARFTGQPKPLGEVLVSLIDRERSEQ